MEFAYPANYSMLGGYPIYRNEQEPTAYDGNFYGRTQAQ
jgi:hypothetical protein